MRPKVRLGVLIDSDVIPAWASVMLDQISRSQSAEIVLFIKNASFQKSTDGFLQKLVKRRKYLLYALFMKVEGQIARSRRLRDPEAPHSVKEQFGSVPFISIEPEETRFSHRLSAADAERLQSYNLDVVVRLGFRILRGNFLKCARYGVWSYHHGDNRINRGVPPGFWEVLEAWPVTGVILQILTEDLDNGRILRRSTSQTDPSFVTQNCSNLYWKAVSLLPRALEELYRTGPDRFFEKVSAVNQHIEFYSNPLRTLPANAQVLRLVSSHYRRRVWNKIVSRFYFKQWILLYDISMSGEISRSFWRFKKCVPPKHLGWTDPFVVFRDGRYYVFLEEIDNTTEKGHLACMTIDTDGKFSSPVKILERPYHLSYPFVFEHEGADYMIPESESNGTIDLYRCVEFPEKWEHVKTLKRNVRAVDSTLLYHEGRWWLFANIREQEGASSEDELFLFHSENLLSEEWTPHSLNPIVSDVSSARPAGRIFRHGGNLYRPSQNNSGFYGNGMKINHIVKLSADDYEEVCVNTIDAKWDKAIVGTHTLNQASGLTVIDGQMWRRR